MENVDNVDDVETFDLGPGDPLAAAAAAASVGVSGALSDADSIGSNATIPSIWEPGSSFNVDEPAVSATDSHQSDDRPPRLLSRSLSLDLCNQRSLIDRSQGRTSSLQNPTITSSGPYSGVHVRLSEANAQVNRRGLDGRRHHCNSDPGVQSVAVSRCCVAGPCDESEPEAPESFSYQHPSQDDADADTDEDIGQSHSTSSSSSSSFSASAALRPQMLRSLSASHGHGHGSEDSGFFSDSRRRPAREELEFSVTFSFKRRREDYK